MLVYFPQLEEFPEILSRHIRERVYTIIGTSMINSLMSPSCILQFT